MCAFQALLIDFNCLILLAGQGLEAGAVPRSVVTARDRSPDPSLDPGTVIAPGRDRVPGPGLLRMIAIVATASLQIGTGVAASLQIGTGVVASLERQRTMEKSVQL